MSNKRIAWIDYVRGIAMLMVVVGHSLPTDGSNYWANLIYIVHMPVFFILSGWLFKQRLPRIVFKKSLWNIILPYVVTSMILLVLFKMSRTFPQPYIYSSFTTGTKILSAIAYGSGMPVINPFGWQIDAVGAIWFLLAFFVATNIFELIMQLRSKRLQIFFVVSSGIVGGVTGNWWSLPWSLNAALLGVTFMYVGYLIRKYEIIEKMNWIWATIGILLWALAACIGIFFMVYPKSLNWWIQFPGAIAASCVICWIAKKIDEKEYSLRLLEIIGQGSLTVLCFHLISLNFDQSIFFFLQKSHIAVNSLAWFLIVIVWRLVFPMVMLTIVKYIPVLKNVYDNRNYPFRFQTRMYKKNGNLSK